MTTNTLEQMTTHLQFLGYEITREGDLVAAKHATKLNVMMRPFAGGVLFTAMFGGNNTAKKKKLGYLEMINSLNHKAAIARFYADDDLDLFIEVWHADNYDRAAFGVFLDKWDRDCQLLIGNSEAIQYLQ